MSSSHPCLTCGACCAFFRVAFYWREAETQEHAQAVPAQLWHELTPWLRGMNGTEKKHNPKCTSLQGRIGELVGCQIYANRPSPCREFQASFENGQINTRCDQARAKHGLPKLTGLDWLKFRSPLKDDRTSESQVELATDQFDSDR